VLAILLVSLAGCAAKAVAPPPVRIIGIFAAELHGRTFSFTSLEGRSQAGPPDRFLQIEGDGVTVSFHVTARPFVPTLRDGAVHMGGHVFAVTPMPNVFLVDGQSYTLRRGGKFIFSDGEYGGEYTGPR